MALKTSFTFTPSTCRRSRSSSSLACGVETANVVKRAADVGILVGGDDEAARDSGERVDVAAVRSRSWYSKPDPVPRPMIGGRLNANDDGRRDRVELRAAAC